MVKQSTCARHDIGTCGTALLFSHCAIKTTFEKVAEVDGTQNGGQLVACEIGLSITIVCYLVEVSRYPWKACKSTVRSRTIIFDSTEACSQTQMTTRHNARK